MADHHACWGGELARIHSFKVLEDRIVQDVSVRNGHLEELILYVLGSLVVLAAAGGDAGLKEVVECGAAEGVMTGAMPL